MWVLKVFCFYLIITVFNSQMNLVMGNEENQIGPNLEILETNLKTFIEEELKKLVEQIKVKKEDITTSLKELHDALKAELQEKLKTGLDEQKTLIEKLFKEKNTNTALVLDRIEKKCTLEGYKAINLPPVAAERMDENFNCVKYCGPVLDSPNTCDEAMHTNYHQDGVYLLNGTVTGQKPFFVYCKRISGKIWTIIQRREDGSVSFFRNWNDYKHGFGNLYGEYWLGLERLHAMTSEDEHELLVWMEDFDGKVAQAHYDHILIANESEKYKLTVDGYKGNAGDGFSKTGLNGGYNGMKFSTHDNCNDGHGKYQYECAKLYKGAWWFNLCYLSHLNGPYTTTESSGLDWNPYAKKLKYAFMAIRPVKTETISILFNSPEPTDVEPHAYPENESVNLTET